MRTHAHTDLRGRTPRHGPLPRVWKAVLGLASGLDPIELDAACFLLRIPARRFRWRELMHAAIAARAKTPWRRSLVLMTLLWSSTSVPLRAEPSIEDRDIEAAGPRFGHTAPGS